MPRAHTESERARIQERLLDAGRESFIRLGLGKVAIEGLTRAAGIGKGSFYHFFASKEELFLAVQEREESVFKAALVRDLDAAGSGREAVRILLLAAATRLEEHPFLRTLLDPATLQALSLRVPAARLDAHRAGDRAYFTRLLRRFKRRGWLRAEVDVNTAFDVLSAVFALSVQSELIGKAALKSAVHELTEAILARWCPAEA